jgi:hypothetical protein
MGRYRARSIEVEAMRFSGELTMELRKFLPPYDLQQWRWDSGLFLSATRSDGSGLHPVYYAVPVQAKAWLVKHPGNKLSAYGANDFLDLYEEI